MDAEKSSWRREADESAANARCSRAKGELVEQRGHDIAGRMLRSDVRERARKK